jgi:hypothetical protein
LKKKIRFELNMNATEIPSGPNLLDLEVTLQQNMQRNQISKKRSKLVEHLAQGNVLGSVMLTDERLLLKYSFFETANSDVKIKLDLIEDKGGHDNRAQANYKDAQGAQKIAVEATDVSVLGSALTSNGYHLTRLWRHHKNEPDTRPGKDPTKTRKKIIVTAQFDKSGESNIDSRLVELEPPAQCIWGRCFVFQNPATPDFGSPSITINLVSPLRHDVPPKSSLMIEGGKLEVEEVAAKK